MFDELDNEQTDDIPGYPAGLTSSDRWLIPCQVTGCVVQRPASPGTTVYRDDSENAATRLNHADEAMYMPGREQQWRQMPAVPSENHLNNRITIPPPPERDCNDE